MRGWARMRRWWGRLRAGGLKSFDPRAALRALRSDCWGEVGNVAGFLPATIAGDAAEVTDRKQPFLASGKVTPSSKTTS
jgi:hypothetical protein